jgi:ubiquinone/menaquinone biosynthesis C-methylase UbiE|uniref:2-methoxy-6-polyprenyl-1,4-benzoquinol methylase, mitochondrial n=1 Tax=Candidatus Methanophaga sp. ANME-1 ERB7 TaxID=2759913 RepID=A0A7G9ZBU9_9EURY|nr:2-methoxy-6-polyprenyl-1,4-benzoquinol methylase, mitochondrial [Methanosarcinales archaeon ANME-1 ERB7]
MNNYIHGYSKKELKRLQDQANTLDELLHYDSIFPENSKILEAGCGVGSQTKIIAPKNPSCHFTSIDISETSLEKVKTMIQALNIKNVMLQIGDIFDLHFEAESFDHIFVCFVLEHLSNPVQALLNLKKVLRKGGTITVIEGDHGSAYFYPRSDAAQKTINCQLQLQALHGGNALIGREIYPLLYKAGFSDCLVSPRMVYVDSSKPFLVEGFIKNTFTAMIEGVEKDALNNSLIDKYEWDQGIKDLYRTAEKDGVFCYTFFKGKAIKK